MTETRKVQPCGMLYSQTREYFLLKPEPIPGDSWEKDNAYRFIVIPRKEISVDSEYKPIYAFARHIVTTAFVVDYAANMPEIEIQVLAEIDITKQEWNDTPEWSVELNAQPSLLTENGWDHLLEHAQEELV